MRHSNVHEFVRDCVLCVGLAWGCTSVAHSRSAFKELGSYVVEINDVEVKTFAVAVVGEGET